MADLTLTSTYTDDGATSPARLVAAAAARHDQSPEDYQRSATGFLAYVDEWKARRLAAGLPDIAFPGIGEPGSELVEVPGEPGPEPTPEAPALVIDGFDLAEWVNGAYRWTGGRNFGRDGDDWANPANVEPFVDGARLWVRHEDTEGWLRDGTAHLYHHSTTILAGTVPFRFGHVEAIMQMAAGGGLWPAFWLLPEPTGPDGPWVWPPEVDVAEVLGASPTVWHGTLHWADTAGAHHQTTFSRTGADLAAAEHRYGLTWEPGRLRWWLDDVLVGEATEHVPDVPMYLLVTFGVGGTGTWAGPIDDAALPASMTVRGLRVFDAKPADDDPRRASMTDTPPPAPEPGPEPTPAPEPAPAPTPPPSGRDPKVKPFADDAWPRLKVSDRRIRPNFALVAMPQAGTLNLNYQAWSHSVFYAKPSDPVVRVYEPRQNGRSVLVRCESLLAVAAGTDRHLHVAQPAGYAGEGGGAWTHIPEGNPWLVETWAATWEDPSTLRVGRVELIDLLGFAQEAGCRAAGVPAIAGLPRREELAAAAAGDIDAIDHPLAVLVYPEWMSNAGTVPPADEMDDGDGRNYGKGPYEMGDRFAFDPSVPIVGGGVAKAVKKAGRDYGFIILDTGGNFAAQCDYQAEAAHAAEMRQALLDGTPYLRYVKR